MNKLETIVTTAVVTLSGAGSILNAVVLYDRVQAGTVHASVIAMTAIIFTVFVVSVITLSAPTPKVYKVGDLVITKVDTVGIVVGVAGDIIKIEVPAKIYTVVPSDITHKVQNDEATT